MSLSNDSMGDHRNDGIAWDLAFAQQTYIQRAGGPLLERINLFAIMLGDTVALAEKKKLAEGGEDMIKLKSLIKLIDGEPKPGGGSSGGLRNLYLVPMDTDPRYNYKARSEIEVLLDAAFRDLKRIIAKHNLTNQAIMALVEANKGFTPKLKEGEHV